MNYKTFVPEFYRKDTDKYNENSFFSKRCNHILCVSKYCPQLTEMNKFHSVAPQAMTGRKLGDVAL